MKTRLFSIGMALMLFAGFASTSCNDENDSVTEPKTTAWSAVVDGADYAEFEALAMGTEVETMLNKKSTFTLFIPTNEAIRAYKSMHEGMSKADLLRVLKYHFSKAEVMTSYSTARLASSLFEDNQYVPLVFSKMGGQLYVNGSIVLSSKQVNENLVIHVVNRVLSPPTNLYEFISVIPLLNSLKAAIDEAGMVELFSSPTARMTLFAPTNSAFERKSIDAGSLEATLKHHVSTTLFFNNDSDWSDLSSLPETRASADEMITGPWFRIMTLGGETLTLIMHDNGFFILNPKGASDAYTYGSGLAFGNSVLYVVDQVLCPNSSMDY